MTDYRKPVEDLAGEFKDYVDLKTEDLKLKTTKGLSMSIARVLTALVLLFVLGLVILTLTVGFVLLLGQATGNYALGAFIACGIFIAVLVLLFTRRKTMFVDGFVKLFIQIFFPDNYE